DDIEYWIGSGSNEAALVIDWKSGNAPTCLAWGYRWDDSATGEDMLTAIAGSGDIRSSNNGPVIGSADGADSRFGIQITDWGGSKTVFGLGYDVDDDGGFVYVNGADETGHAADADDNYHEGWDYGFWHYAVSTDGVNWDSSGFVGFSGRTLSTGDWDGWSWDPSFSFAVFPNEPAAATPEPGTISLLALGVAAALLRRCRKRQGCLANCGL
ncbi:MAG TPA: PEP-CTERM sorting domain-containing protein, partial [Phycisphaerae bacterium]|nr:PEP-CTERM sorting domain-containing protein [Phycisphaerae bacterium]